MTSYQKSGLRRGPRIIVVGSSNTDLVLSCAHLPKPGETLLGGEFQRYAGGKGANQAVAAARAGAQVTFIGARGRDDFGRAAVDSLRREKIDVRYFVELVGAPSGIALILLGGKTRENMIAVARSANDLVSAKHLHAARAEFKRAQVVVAQLEVPLATVIRAAEMARAHKIPFLLNPAPARPLPKRLLQLVHTLTPNESEAALLTGESDPVKAGAALLKTGCQQIVITLGAKGALLVDANGPRPFRAPRVKPVDTVGAGDCFTGWLAIGMAEGLPIAQAVERALRAASLSVARPGAQPGMPYRREIAQA
jgi:ribokinase